MSFIKATNLFLLGGFFIQVARQQSMACQRVRSRCNTLKSKRCYGNNDVKESFYSLSFDIYCGYLFSVTEKK